jgi:methyl-accepting chemotaxis protein
MSKLNLNTKLIGGFMLMGLILLIGGLLGPHGISRLGGELKEVSEVHFPAVHSLGTMIESQRTIHRVKHSLMIPEYFSDEAEKDRLFKMLEEAWSRADSGWKSYETLPRTQEGDALWNNLKSAWEAWRKSQAEVIQLLKEGKRTEAVTLSIDRERETFGRAERLLLHLSALNLKLGEEAKKTGQAMETWQKSVVFIGTTIGIIVALIFGFFFSRSLTRPLQRIINNLSETYAQFMTTADQIATASHQLASGTSSQAAAVEEASSITEELASIVQINTEDVQRLKDTSTEGAKLGAEVSQAFQQAKQATKEIRLSSEETSKIIKTIGEIAFQTNLLALSASVEAVQTNKVGIGFSVVAQEVRNLATRSTEAAKNTSALIEKTVKLITRGDDLVRASRGYFMDFARASIPITGFTAAAFETAQKQAQGIDQINIALGEISRTAQNNASSAQESASVAQEMTAQANIMKNIVEDLKKVVGDRG